MVALKGSPRDLAIWTREHALLVIWNAISLHLVVVTRPEAKMGSYHEKCYNKDQISNVAQY